MYIPAMDPFGIGSKVVVMLESSNGAVALGEAEVVWARGAEVVEEKSGFGLRFTQLPPDARALVETLLKHGGSTLSTPPHGTRIPVLSAEDPTPTLEGGPRGGPRKPSG
jgi:Tfp pilus assembly protein PilZ